MSGQKEFAFRLGFRGGMQAVPAYGNEGRGGGDGHLSADKKIQSCVRAVSAQRKRVGGDTAVVVAKSVSLVRSLKMSDEMRWQYGLINSVEAAVDAATVIELGDLLWQDVYDAKPALALGTRGNPIVDQGLFVAKFLGVAMQRSRSGDTAPISVATTGVFQFDCSRSTFELGELIGPVFNACEDRLFNQRVIRVYRARHAIGRVTKYEHDLVGSVLVDIRSTVMTGGVFNSQHSRRG